ncbi:hypothetical protein ATCVCanal1_006R [Acanthocystis turfacea Chlorella virus Canal-1]|nr:hypothetical protein ATCVCanal1_006R [Acanthocystis turfacea Chlorella virus Canal-1]
MTTNVGKFFAKYPIPSVKELLSADYPGTTVEIHSWLLGGRKEYMKVQNATHAFLLIDDVNVPERQFMEEIDNQWGLSFFCAYCVITKDANMLLQSACEVPSVTTIRTSANMIRVGRSRYGFDIHVDDAYIGVASNAAKIYDIVKTKVSDATVQHVYINPAYD